MKRFILIAVVGVLDAVMIGAAGSGTKANEDTDTEPLKAEGVTV